MKCYIQGMETTQTWTEASIVNLLNGNDRAVERAMVAIWKRQTEDEQRSENTHWRNDIGFSGADARRGSYFAQWVMRGNRLTGTHLAKARAMAIKYRKQLLSIASK